MNKAIEENKLTVTIKRLLWFTLYLKFMWTDKNNDNNKTNLPLLTSNPVTVFLIAEKLLSLQL